MIILHIYMLTYAITIIIVIRTAGRAATAPHGRQVLGPRFHRAQGRPFWEVPLMRRVAWQRSRFPLGSSA